jgi:rhamnulokinase
MSNVIAVDLGAESGRVIQVGFDGKHLTLNEAHRFANIPVTVRGTLHWDVLRLWHDIQDGIRRVATPSHSIGVDTWGVDFALLDKDGNLIGNPVHYRDSGKDGAMEWVFGRVPRELIFQRTGIQFMSFNGIYQLASMLRANSAQLPHIHTAFTMPDLFNYWLSGAKTAEFTNATTTQAYNQQTQDWDSDTLHTIGLSPNIFPSIVYPGTRLGDYNGIPVTAVACHDTGSAFVAVPSLSRDVAVISSGTWSLVGMELDAPLINEAVYHANITNEGGAYGTVRFLKNVMGLWLAQQCRLAWNEQGANLSYDDLTQLANTAPTFTAFIDPDDARFLRAGDMPTRIQQYLGETHQTTNGEKATLLRVIYESLALKYRYVLDNLRELTGKNVHTIHIIGGGSKNALLCQMTANATGCEVVAGPDEATAIGNALVQFIALGDMANLAQAREILSQTITTKRYTPQDVGLWQEAYGRFGDILLQTNQTF